MFDNEKRKSCILPEVLVEEIISYLPRCSKCEAVVWFSRTLNSCYLSCNMCSKRFCHSCLRHIDISYYEGHFDVCQRCIYMNNYFLKIF